MNYLGVKSPSHFFLNNDEIMPYVKVQVGKGRSQSTYILTDNGIEIISLMLHFKDYYSSL